MEKLTLLHFNSTTFLFLHCLCFDFFKQFFGKFFCGHLAEFAGQTPLLPLLGKIMTFGLSAGIVAAKGLLEHHGPEAVMARLFGLGAVGLAVVFCVVEMPAVVKAAPSCSGPCTWYGALFPPVPL